MTGVGGGPEIIIEGSNSLQGPWKVICLLKCDYIVENFNAEYYCPFITDLDISIY